MSTPVALECPKCGAPLPPGPPGSSVTCAFCETVVTRAPERVVERIIERVVVSAAAPAGARVAAPGEVLSCPRCSLPLFRGEVSGVVLEGCGACGGIWLDNAGTQQAVAHPGPALIAMAERAAARAPNEAPTSALIACPVCAQPLRRVVAPRSSAELDVCAAHGTWFDRSELARVARAYLPVPQVTEADLQAAAALPAPAPPPVAWGSVLLGGAFTVLELVLTADKPPRDR